MSKRRASALRLSGLQWTLLGLVALLLGTWLMLVSTEWLPRLSARETQDLALLQLHAASYRR